MRQISIKKKLLKYYKIYEQIYENPSVPLYQITKNTGISRSTVSRYLLEMYNLSIMKGPMIFVKPAGNYHQYASLMKFEHSMTAYRRFHGFPHIISRSLSSGSWNLLLLYEKQMNFSRLKGFQEYVAEGAKGVTYLSKVSFLDWESSLKKINDVVFPPKQKSILYEEIPSNPWKEKEWTLYHKFKYNIRIQAMPVLKECGVRFQKYQNWSLQLSDVALIQPAFYPEGLNKYFMFDFLFKSEHQKQLVEILGMLPATSLFFSIGNYLFARLFLLTKREHNDLFSLVFRLGEEKFFTDFCQAVVISTPERGV
jgi:hypothetical protein